ncbi:hemerythrin domain-containing protein [Sphingorhabdus sp. M41]|uniref:hemerythrin domain-containing protein n=1 Tax=Sphingorhabdus sp. M41 TaxID=1806885 RepID=UPI00078DB1B1|nr:hemerythrin domain-containing protein [Sphingorhabdus sp. M41]AMO71793.1 hypothetical protein AZE99_07940 [Sphingorhabdus sp. M41]
MTKINHGLFNAFREDHAILGRGLHELRSLVTAGDVGGLKSAAQNLDKAAGGHIAFEEEDFYPALKTFLSADEVEEMYAEHAHGAETLSTIAELDPDIPLHLVQKQQLLDRIDEMEQHVSECGELFGAMGGLDEAAKDDLMKRLQYWRKLAPAWTDFATKQPE